MCGLCSAHEYRSIHRKSDKGKSGESPANAGGDELRETLLQCARLQQVRAKKLLSPADVAALYGIPPATLATWRCRGVGPDFIKAESSVYYLPEQVDAWLRRCAVVMPR